MKFFLTQFLLAPLDPAEQKITYDTNCTYITILHLKYSY